MQVAVLRVGWREALNAPYRAIIDIEVASPDEDPLLLLGQDAVLTLARGADLERRLCGVVTDVEHLEHDNPEHTYARLVLEPALALLELSQRTRIFQEKKVSDILDEVLGEALGVYGREHELSLDETYPTREYCLQYRESDLAFIDRLAEEEGISYAFDHEGEKERVVFRDRNTFPAAPIAGSTIPFDPRAGANMDGDEVIRELSRVSIPTTTKLTSRDHDWTSPANPREGTAGEDGRESYEFGLGRSLTISDYSGERYGAHDAGRQAGLRLEALTRDAVVLEGQSRVIGLAPGTTFEVAGHSADLDGEYIVIAVEHRSTEVETESDAYANRFLAIANSVPYRPVRQRPKPRVSSVQTAIVTGPSGQEIHTDSHGRIKVQFHWDLAAPGDDTSSCWVRVSQAWAGNSWGFVFLPRVGMEVVVHFQNGDPDRPIVQGCLYNSEHHPPYPLPDEKTKSTIKSQSSPGGGGFNELRFEDLAGSEQIYLHAQKDLDEVVGLDHTTHVHVDQTNKVKNNQTQKIEGKQTEQIDGHQTQTIGGSRTVKVTKKFKEVVQSGEKRVVGGEQKEFILSAGSKRVIVGTHDEHINLTETRIVSGGQKEAVLVKVLHTIKSGHTETVTGMLNQITLDDYTLSGNGTGLVKASSLINVLALGGMTYQAVDITVDSTVRIQIDPVWFAMAPSSNSSFYGAAITLAGGSASATGLSFTKMGASISIVGTSVGYFGAKLSFTGLDATWASNPVTVDGMTGYIGFRVFLN